jgi:hypothetical protein
MLDIVFIRLPKWSSLTRRQLQAPRQYLSSRPIAKLDQSEKPKSPGFGTGQGVIFMNEPRSRLTKQPKNFLCRIIVLRKVEASWRQRCDTAINWPYRMDDLFECLDDIGGNFPVIPDCCNRPFGTLQVATSHRGGLALPQYPQGGHFSDCPGGPFRTLQFITRHFNLPFRLTRNDGEEPLFHLAGLKFARCDEVKKVKEACAAVTPLPDRVLEAGGIGKPLDS